jgi:penicillin-binding protein 1A
VWIGYDSRQSLGEKETGAKAALPVWMTFMKAAIAGKPDEKFSQDEPENNLLKAGKSVPAKPGTTQPASASLAHPARSVPPVKSSAPSSSAIARVVPPPDAPAAGQPVKVVIDLPTNDSPVKSLLHQTSSPDQVHEEVKPSLGSPRQ